MTFSLIDRALNVVMTGMVYGSELWITCAFGFFVATREPLREQKRASRQSVYPTVDQGKIEITIELPLSRAGAPEQMGAQDFSVQETVEELVQAPVQAPIKKSVQKAMKKPRPEASQKANRQTDQKATEQTKPGKAKAATETVLEPACLSQKIQEVAASAPILCEPVNWKQWKVADLRKASMAKVCGVRIRPIGSRRNLSKADLIAQYEQQMRRLTKSPMKRTREEEVA
ncbi:MAG: hypothetical protein WA901_16930 [Phormidesmis sp.]